MREDQPCQLLRAGTAGFTETEGAASLHTRGNTVQRLGFTDILKLAQFLNTQKSWYLKHVAYVYFVCQ